MSASSVEKELTRPVVYSSAEEQADHRLRSGFVPLITFAVIVAAAAVTSAVVFSGGAQTRRVPPAVTNLNSSSAGLLEARTSPKPTGPMWPKRRFDSAVASPNAEGQVNVGVIPLTLAPGWKVKDATNDMLEARNSRGDFFVWDFPALPEDTIDDLLGYLMNLVRAGLTNPQISQQIDMGLKGKRFQESREIQFSGTVKDEQGTAVDRSGAIAALLNPTNSDAALIIYGSSDPNDFKANENDVRTMIESMLN